MKNWIDTTTVEPKITRKATEMADFVFGTGFRDEKSKFIAAHYTREQYITANGIQRAISETSGVTLDIMDILGKTPAEIQAKFELKCGMKNRRAGVVTLEKKYGHESAARIVKNHSGRNIC